MDDKHDNAIKHHEEMLFLQEHQKKMKPREAKSFWSAVRKTLEMEIRMHELYIVIKDRVERYGK